MKKTFHLMYYILFVAGLWLLNRQFQNFVAVNGALEGLLVGLVLAFLVRLIFKTVTRVALCLIVMVGIIVFLFSVDYLTWPDWVLNLWHMIPVVRSRIGI